MNGDTQPRIYYTKPSITDLEASYAEDAATNGWGEHCYDYIHRFERQFREYLGVRYAIATSSGTGALHLGMAGVLPRLKIGRSAVVGAGSVVIRDVAANEVVVGNPQHGFDVRMRQVPIQQLKSVEE